jgi:FAD-dependent urate hydroxylase
MLDLAIIGAGPYGLSIAAHAKKAGLDYQVFGYPMEFWHSKMPPNMYIRTLVEHTGLSDPDYQYTLKNYQAEKKVALEYPLPRSILVDYAKWFINKTNISIHETYITNVGEQQASFTLLTEKGQNVVAKRVIVAVGLTNAKYIPDTLRHLSEDQLSHTSDYTSYQSFKGKSVLVVGGGQSAWEAAALLHQAGAKVDLAYRRANYLSPDKHTNAKQKELASKFYYLSQQEKDEIRKQLERPTVSDFLVPLVEGKVKQRPNTMITSVTVNDHMQVQFNDNTHAIFDHIIVATGYRFLVHNLSFLHQVIAKIDTNEVGEPIVNESFESSLSNMFFVGPAASYSHGPTFRFISGVWRTSEILINNLTRDDIIGNESNSQVVSDNN